MSTIRLLQTTTLTPEQFVAGLTDFGPGRSQLFQNSAALPDRRQSLLVAAWLTGGPAGPSLDRSAGLRRTPG